MVDVAEEGVGVDRGVEMVTVAGEAVEVDGGMEMIGLALGAPNPDEDVVVKVNAGLGAG